MTEPQRFDFLRMSRSLQTARLVVSRAGTSILRPSEKALLGSGLSDIEDFLQACQDKREEAAKGINGYKGTAR